ncbi:MAG: hypothetical protein AAGE92_14490, partial [Cyanobacteria bacterium P01_G01_bin.4]
LPTTPPLSALCADPPAGGLYHCPDSSMNVLDRMRFFGRGVEAASLFLSRQLNACATRTKVCLFYTV